MASCFVNELTINSILLNWEVWYEPVLGFEISWKWIWRTDWKPILHNKSFCPFFLADIMLDVLEFMIDVEHEVVYDDPAAPLKLSHWSFIKFGYPLLDDKIIQMVLDLNLSLRANCCKNQVVLFKTKDSLSKKSEASLTLNCHWEVEFNESHD